MNENELPPLLNESEERRPGITKLYQRIRAEHRDWTQQQVAEETKRRYQEGER